MALNIDADLEEISSWIVSEEDMAQLLIYFDLIDESAYKESKIKREKRRMIDEDESKTSN